MQTIYWQTFSLFRGRFTALLAALGISILFARPLAAQTNIITSPSAANIRTALAAGGTVLLEFNGTVTLSTPLVVSTDVTMDATGFSVTISGNNVSQVFQVATNVHFTAKNFSIANGKSAGATGSTGANGSGTMGNGNGNPGGNGGNGGDGVGGAVKNMGISTWVNCTFLNNSATGGNGGSGGIGVSTGSSTGGNGGNGGGGGNAYGGAIYNLSAVVLSNCTFAGNTATAGNGGVGGTNGTLQFSGTPFPGNGGSGGAAAGASLYNLASATATIYGCTFSSNSIQAGNTQTLGGSYGANGNGAANGGNGNPGGSATGGAICNLGTNSVINSTFYANSATGGNGGNGENACPGYGTDGGAGGSGGNGLGGGVYNSGTMGMTNSTLAVGYVYGGAGGLVGSGPFTNKSNGSTGGALGANIYNASGTFNFKNSILSSPGTATSAAGTITDQGYNISSDSTPTFTSTNSADNLNPQLTALTNNGGPTLTLALGASSPAIYAADSTAAPAQDQRGYYWVGAPSIGAYDYGAIAVPIVQLYVLGQTASEDGDVGMFFVQRTGIGPARPFTINFNISGTATNGVNYATLSNSITIPSGFLSAQILVRALPGTFTGGNLSAVLSVATNSQYTVDTNFASGGVILQPKSTFNPTARFVRGTSTAPDYQSFVIPLSSETGVPLAAVGGNATTLFPGNPWTTNFYHFDATNLNSQTGTNNRFVFQNPMVAFGSPVGGSPLYVNRTYQFGFSGGIPNYPALATELRIQVYTRSNSAFAGTISLPIPDVSMTGPLTAFATNGFTVTTNSFGMTVVWSTDYHQRWGNSFGQNFLLSHVASLTATNYYYVVEAQGFNPNFEYTVRNQSGNPDWSKLYALEFSPFPTSLSTFIDQPHFQGAPLPPQYQGMSVTELTNVQPTLPNLSSLNPSNYLTIDGSPELRRHPTLDQFVASMNNDPLALANYVINEIDLTDAIDYDTNYNSQPAVNLGGVDRGALATFQEGQGSPAEQCALLIYLLRQAGVPAAYVYPTNNGMQMLDFQLSKLLRVQLVGAMSSTAETNLPQLISVNYPWVAAYIGTNWIQIFPWLKDTSISEGFNLYDYMPTNYNSGFKWMTHFLTNDPNIFSLGSSDQPADLLPLFIQTNLDLNYPGMSIDDLGVQIVNRRHLYARWSDFPLPFALSGTPTVIESLKTNMNLFNTLDIQVYSQANPGKSVDTTEMRVLDFHNRKLLLKFVQVGGGNTHNMVLTLSPYSTNITNVTAFSTNADSTWELTVTNQLNSSDDALIYQITHRRNKFLPSGYVAPAYDQASNLWNYTYAEFGQQQAGKLYQFQETSFRKGDLLSFCIDTGRVTQKMLNVQAQEIWQFNQAMNSTNPPTPNLDIYAGTTAYLLGMSYFNYYDNFNVFSSHLHKIQPVTSFAYGFGVLRPQRDTSGNLVSNGVVNLITPAVHIREDGVGLIFNGTLHPNSGLDYPTAYYDWFIQDNLQGSAAEHGVLRGFYGTNAISTVKLLQQVGTNMLILTPDNYFTAATNVYGGVQLQNADPTLWTQLTSFFASSDPEEVGFLTPGAVTNGTYTGMGALLLSHNFALAYIGGLNGGVANNLPASTFSSGNAANLTVEPAPDGSTSPYTLQSASQVNNAAEPVDGATTADALPTTAANLANGTQIVDPNLQQASVNLSALLGIPNTPAGGFNAVYLNQGALGTFVPTYMDSQMFAAEPVNIMTGEFYVDAVDLTLPGPLSLQVRRNYSSQNQVENEFGFGWKMNYMPFLSVGTNSTLIYAAEMDGTIVAYRKTSTNANVWLPQPQDNPTLNNDSSLGMGSVANLFNNRLQVASGTNIYTLTGADGSIRTFVQNSFPIGTFSRQRPYLTSWQDNRGNSYGFQYGTNSTQPDWGELNRIQSTSGDFVEFYYDTFGHIIEAITGDGRILQYAYDKYGDLVTVTLPDESQINYVYQHANQVTNSVTNVYSTHLILQELKPESRILQNAYDSQRRVTNQMATVGATLVPIVNASFAYTNNFSLSSPTNLLTGTTAVYDYTNHVTVYTYTNSLIDKIVDPLTHSIVQTWYGAATNGGYPRSLQSRTDQRGLVTSYLYDTNGNVTNSTVTGDLTGSGVSTNAVTTATYNANNSPLLITDPVGNATQVIYSTTYPFLPQQVIKLANGTAWCTNYSIYTNVSALVTNGSLVLTNSAYGLLTRSIRAYSSPDAATNDQFYNAQGFVTNTIQYTGTSDPAVTNYFFYNERGELIQRTDAAGRAYTFFYDPMGRPAGQETFDVGQSLPMDWKYLYYNDNGELNWIDGPRYNPEDYVFYDYDGAGRKIQEIHWRSQGNQDGSGVSAVPGYGQFATTFYQCDPLGDLTQVTDPLGNYTVQNFDAIGQMLKQVAYASNGTALTTNLFSYEPGGKVAATTNALGGVTSTAYNSKGQPESQSNPDGSTNGWRYDLSGRVVQQFTTYGSFWQTTYDDLHQRVTKVFMNGATPLATNIAQLDHRGNAIQKIDANGNLYTNFYDGLDRIKIAAGPAMVTVSGSTNGPPGLGGGLTTNTVQQIETYVYDGSGQVMTVSNALGEKTVTTSDPLGRSIRVEVFSAGNTSVRVTTTGYSADHNSVTVTNGTGTNAIVNLTYTDTQGNPVLNIGYPTNGIIEYSWQQYDADGNRIAQQQLSSSGGVITTWATNGWTYDGLNRVATETTRDGATTAYSYDALGDVTNQAMPGGLSWSASYLSDGRMATEQEHGGSLTTRTNSYTYYGAGSPFAGLLMTRVDGRGTLTTNLNYDAFLRTTDLHTFGSAPEQNIYRHFQYDAVGNVVWMFESPSYIQFSDTQIVRGYDAYNRINDDYTEVDRATTSTYWEGFQSWDSAGRRANLQTGINTSCGYRADGLLTQANGSTFSYANNGLLASRTTGAKTVAVNQRDGRGRVLKTTTTFNTVPVLTENLSYRNDGRLSTYTASRDFTDARNYSYSALANRVTQESFGLSSMSSGTNNYTIDNNVAGGLGILTSATESGGKTASWSVPGSGGLDGLSRVAQAQDTLVRRSAIGTANGASTVSASLDGDPLNVQFDGNDVGYRSGVWRLDMDLSPGSHTLNVSAVDETGYIFGSSNSTFSVATNAGDTIQNTYDGNGNVSMRVWVNALGQTNRTQALTWDAFDRLVVVNQRDTNGNGFDWTACYDSLGRRIETTCDMVQTNVEVVGPLVTDSTIDSWYDPQVEFEEVGAVVDDVGYWKTLGPDANGVYGGMQGTGGLESVLQDGHTSAVGVIQDYFGDVIGTMSGGTLTWNTSRFSSYGPVPGYQSPAFSPEVGLAQSLGWRGKRVDETGLINLGARHYDAVAGRFLNADPLGHSGSQDLYSFCGGDPVNHFDPDGRLGIGYYRGISTSDSTGDPVLDFANGVVDDTFNLAGRFVNGIVQGGATVSDMIGSSATGLYDFAFGTQYQGYYQGYSQTYQNIYNNPSSGPSRGQILLGTGEAELNVATLGAFGMAQGTINGIQTGNWNQAQDASLNALFLSSGTQAMQNAGVNPWSVGYVPNPADQALLSLFKNDSQTPTPAASTPAPANTATPAANAAPRTFSSTDPLVADLANDIEAQYPGHVQGVNVPLYDASGKLVTDADIQLQNAVIQVKSGGGAQGLLRQLQASEAATGLPSIGFGPNLPPNSISTLLNQGGLVTSDRALLIQLVKP